MKKISLLLSLVTLLTVSSFANTKEVKKIGLKPTSTLIKKVVRVAPIKVYCNGVYAGSFTCSSCTTQQIINIALSFCDWFQNRK